MKISLIFTILNEEEHIPRLLSSIARQSLLPQEIVICDGGSSDNTVSILGQWSLDMPMPIRILSRPGSNISTGRNIAISNSSHGYIAVTDAGVELAEDWLESISEPIRKGLQDSNKLPNVISGNFTPYVSTIFEVALAATTLPALDEFERWKFTPSSRSIMFTKKVWEQVGGYPEWLDFSEDLYFDRALQVAAAVHFGFAPEAIVYYRPRSSIGEFFKQYFRYARGDGKAYPMLLRRHLLRYVAYSVSVLLILFSILTHNVYWSLFLPIGLVLHLRYPLFRRFPTVTGGTTLERVAAIVLIPLLQVVGDMAKMVGYVAGLYWRIRQHTHFGVYPNERSKSRQR